MSWEDEEDPLEDFKYGPLDDPTDYENYSPEEARGWVISFIEHGNGQGHGPVYLVNLLIQGGFEYNEAVELYRQGTLAWKTQDETEK